MHGLYYNVTCICSSACALASTITRAAELSNPKKTIETRASVYYLENYWLLKFLTLGIFNVSAFIAKPSYIAIIICSAVECGNVQSSGVVHGDHSLISRIGTCQAIKIIHDVAMAEAMASDDDSCQENIWIFIDDSYIWIKASKAARVKSRYNLKTTEDHRIHISVGGLIEVVCRKKRNVKKSTLYGSAAPPSIDSVWKKAEEYGFEVKCYHKNKAGKEKVVDTQLVTDVTEIATMHAGESTNGIIAIIFGDVDCSPAIEVALFIYLFIFFIYLAAVTYNQVQPLRINYLATEFLPKLEL